ncbi:MAG: riboflavin kinase [Thermoprotei archaeon]|nr:MAG: riboflavin kinase [Thermoprotei archaeon]
MKVWERVFIMYTLALLGVHSKPMNITTEELGRRLGLTPQSVSRKLIELENEGLIKRMTMGRYKTIVMTRQGYELLLQLHRALSDLLERRGEGLVLRGRVFTGLGEGRKYLSIEEYRRQFLEKLNMDPYPGTLNIRLDSDSTKMKGVLEIVPGIIIKGFRKNDVEYGGAKAFKATINDSVPCAVLLIDRTHYGREVLEIISNYYLRGKLGLVDGDLVTVRVFYTW